MEKTKLCCYEKCILTKLPVSTGDKAVNKMELVGPVYCFHKPSVYSLWSAFPDQKYLVKNYTLMC